MTHSFPTRRSSDLVQGHPIVDDPFVVCDRVFRLAVHADDCLGLHGPCSKVARLSGWREFPAVDSWQGWRPRQRWGWWARPGAGVAPRSEEHTSELQSLMRSSYAVLCLKQKNT